MISHDPVAFIFGPIFSTLILFDAVTLPWHNDESFKRIVIIAVVKVILRDVQWLGTWYYDPVYVDPVDNHPMYDTVYRSSSFSYCGDNSVCDG